MPTLRYLRCVQLSFTEHLAASFRSAISPQHASRSPKLCEAEFYSSGGAEVPIMLTCLRAFGLWEQFFYGRYQDVQMTGSFSTLPTSPLDGIHQRPSHCYFSSCH